MKKALIYCRTATRAMSGEEIDSTHSIEEQKRTCENIIKLLGKYEPAENGFYYDIGESGNNIRRIGLKQLLERVQRDNNIGAVVVSNLDRLARNVRGYLELKATLGKAGVELLDSVAVTPEEEFIRAVLTSTERYERATMSARIKRGLEAKKTLQNKGIQSDTLPLL